LPDPQFEVATIRPAKSDDRGKGFRVTGRRISCENETMNDIISYAYNLHPKQIVGGPEWFGTAKYDIEGVPDVPGTPDSQQMLGMYRKLLADRFQLTFHHEQREMSVYTLTVAKGGPKLKAADPDEGHGSGCDRLGVCKFRSEPAEHFARWLQLVMDKPVVDKTGLTGQFDFTLTWTPDESQFTSMGIHVPPAADNPNAPPGLFTALQEQLGLKLDPAKTTAEVLVIDHVERPSEN
jgi:uncharacterized protein (TIGR03435 family)